MAVKVVQKPFQTLEHIFAKPKDPPMDNIVCRQTYYHKKKL